MRAPRPTKVVLLDLRCDGKQKNLWLVSALSVSLTPNEIGSATMSKTASWRYRSGVALASRPRYDFRPRRSEVGLFSGSDAIDEEVDFCDWETSGWARKIRLEGFTVAT